jgi:DNA helicase INO80
MANVAQTGKWGPFLLVTPRTSLVQWEAQLERAAPELRVMPYWGSADDRASLRAYWDPLCMYSEVRMRRAGGDCTELK